MSTYVFAMTLLGIICAMGIALAIRAYRRRIICPNCSPRAKFGDNERVGLCRSCATTHEFKQFRLARKEQLGIVCLKMPPRNHPPRFRFA